MRSLYKINIPEHDSDNADLSEFFGSVKISVDGLDAQRRLRDEWR